MSEVDDALASSGAERVDPATSASAALEKREVARRLGTKVETVYELVRSGQLVVVPCGAREKIRVRDVERLVENGWGKPGRLEEQAPIAKKPRQPRRAEEPPPESAEELARAIGGIKV